MNKSIEEELDKIVSQAELNGFILGIVFLMTLILILIICQT